MGVHDDIMALPLPKTSSFRFKCGFEYGKSRASAIAEAKEKEYRTALQDLVDCISETRGPDARKALENAIELLDRG